jgi:hypothetical protein
MPNYIDVIHDSQRVMTWLRHRLPLSLLADLAELEGPRSREIYTWEAITDDVAWDAAEASRREEGGYDAETG